MFWGFLMLKFCKFSSLFLPLILAVTLLGGCGFGDVQFEGKVFDAVGLSGQQARREDPKVKARAPLVLPPDAKLPEPGKRAVVADDHRFGISGVVRRSVRVVVPEVKRDKVHPRIVFRESL